MKTNFSLTAIIGLGASLAMTQAPVFAQHDNRASGQADTSAQSEQEQPQPVSMAEMEAKAENGFTYLCGGIGENESAQMKQAARNYDMMLTFATRRGNYLADVNVAIKDAKGNTLLQTTCEAPIMLVDFPKSGVYRIHAETAGYALDKTARVQANRHAHASLVLHWPQQVADSMESQPVSTGDSGSANDSSTAPNRSPDDGKNGAR